MYFLYAYTILVNYMITISVCMIVKDEEDVLETALESIKDIADEIIIVDTGSTDQTKDIAKKYTDHIYDFQWCDDFSKARNYSFSQATQDYCMWLDADDILLEKDQKDLLELKNTLPSKTSVVMMKYNVDFDNDGNPLLTYYRERLLRRQDQFTWEGFVHEAITPHGEIIYSDITVTHWKRKNHTDRNLNIYQKKMNEYIVFSPREMFYYARELYYHEYYDQAIEMFKKFLETKKGWKENNISACLFLGYCYHYQKDQQKAIDWLLKSFYYDIPRAEICCVLAQYFYECACYEQAIYWNKIALTCQRQDQSGAFISPDCYDYIPYMQLCVCYDALGNHEKAHYYNEMAGECKPNNPSYLYNKQYFEKRKHI